MFASMEDLSEGALGFLVVCSQYLISCDARFCATSLSACRPSYCHRAETRFHSPCLPLAHLSHPLPAETTRWHLLLYSGPIPLPSWSPTVPSHKIRALLPFDVPYGVTSSSRLVPTAIRSPLNSLYTLRQPVSACTVVIPCAYADRLSNSSTTMSRPVAGPAMLACHARIVAPTPRPSVIA